MNKSGGGSLTTAHGLKFEQETSLENSFIDGGFYISENKCVYDKDDVFIGQILADKGYKNPYQQFIKENGITEKDVISQKLRPDCAFLSGDKQIIYIIEKKFQNTSGSVDEKIQTCDYKKKQYSKIFSQLGIKVEYWYVFNDWFKQDRYKDVLEYIVDSGCNYFFNNIPLSYLLH